jgi:apoptotic chromatin condensation inducer in the nucleus
MDFDVEPEEEPAAPPPTSKAAKETSDDPRPLRGKRAREPIPGVKAPPRVTTGGQHSDTPAAKVQRLDSGTPSASTRKLSTQSEVPLLTPRQRSSVKAPPPNMEPTPALRIDNFMRPCTLPQVKQLLSQDGAVIKENCFWMNSIKTHCYVIFETAEQAEVIRQATFNVQFPRDSQKRLAPKFVTVEEAEGVISGTVSGTPRTAAAPAAAATPAAASEPTESPGHVDARRDILERRQQRQQTAKPPPPQEEELGLDDLFRKTETAPHLYWLPKGLKGESTASSIPEQTANGKI